MGWTQVQGAPRALEGLGRRLPRQEVQNGGRKDEEASEVAALSWG